MRRVLEEYPEAAFLPLFDECLEFPLCLALRANCCLDTVSLLLAHHANPMAVGLCGRTALTILSEKESPAGGASLFWELPFCGRAAPTIPQVGNCEDDLLRIAVRLLDSTADPEERDMRGQTAAEVAEANGYRRLACTWQHRGSFLGLVTLRRHCEQGARGGACTESSLLAESKLHADFLFPIFKMLLPPAVLKRAWALSSTV